MDELKIILFLIVLILFSSVSITMMLVHLLEKENDLNNSVNRLIRDIRKEKDL